MAFLQFLFLVFVVALAVGGFVVWRVFHTIRQAARQFTQQGNATTQQSSSSTQRTTTTSTGDVIIDRRSPEQSHQKIFQKGEGEYVEFEEES